MRVESSTSHAQWLRSTLCEDLADLSRANGQVPDTRAIEAKVDEDIRRWSRQQSEQKPRWSSPVDKKPDDERHQAAKHLAQERDFDLKVSKAEDDVLPGACPCGGVCHMCRLRQRLLVLMEPVPLAERIPKVEMWKNAKRPAWAKEVLDAWAWMKFSKRARALKGKGELERVMLRKLEDIADRSTAIPGLGGWR